MKSDLTWRRRRVEITLTVVIALIGLYISRPQSPTAAREILHWVSAALAAWFLGSAAWSIISKPDRIFRALGYLMLGVSMSLQFIGDLAAPASASNVEAFSLSAMLAGFLLFWTDHQKNEVPPQL